MQCDLKIGWDLAIFTQILNGHALLENQVRHSTTMSAPKTWFVKPVWWPKQDLSQSDFDLLVKYQSLLGKLAEFDWWSESSVVAGKSESINLAYLFYNAFTTSFH